MVTTTMVEAEGRQARADVVIRLLGQAETTVGGQVVPVLTAPRATRLMARLTLAGGWVSRAQLARELWPDSDGAQARTNLRKVLHHLRHSIPGPPDVVDVGGSLVRWSAGPAVWVDVVAFRDALARGDPAAATGCYGGDLLPGWDDDWVVAERERLRRLAVEALADLANSAEAAGRDTEVVEHARHLLRIDPLHEPACRLLMRALTRQGERGEALRSYDRLAARLDDDLGTAPEPVTTALADELRCTAPHEGATHALVGRSRALTTLTALTS